ncbi:MAG TPA: holo-ACP synthase [Rickettsiales bacterium]|nr:holo-ACP synthase [Rickettsiales bacterium]
MIIGIGVDIISIGRIEQLERDFGDKFVTKIFSDNENIVAKKIKVDERDFTKRSIFYAKRFAAKEAFSKACGLGIGRGIDFKDIEIANDKLGQPLIKILNGKKDFLCQHFACKDFVVHLSISDEIPLAQAFVIIEKI